MIALTHEMRDHIDNARANGKPCLLATASGDGYPGIGYRGSMLVYDDEHLTYWEWSRESGLEHLRENPHVAVLIRVDLIMNFGSTVIQQREPSAS